MQIVILVVLLLFLELVSSEIEVTFSNEDEDEQSFIVKTQNPVLNNSDSQSPIQSSAETFASSNGVIALLKILKGNVVLLEKTTADIGLDGYDMDIHSDLLDTGENELDLLLLSENGDIIQQEKISVFSPPTTSAGNDNDKEDDDTFVMASMTDNNCGNESDPSNHNSDCDNNSDMNNIRDSDSDGDNISDRDTDNISDSDGDGDSKSDSGATSSSSSFIRQTLPQWRQKCSSLYARMRDIASTPSEDQYVRLVTATCGTMGVVAGGAWMYALRTKKLVANPPPSQLPLPPPPRPPPLLPPPLPPPPSPPVEKATRESLLPSRDPPSPNETKKKKPPAYKSKFPRYPLLASATPIDFASPKALTTVKRTATPTSASASTSTSGRGGSGSDLVSNVKDLLLGQPRRPGAYSLLLQGGVALLGVQAAKSLISQISNSKDTQTNRGSIFRVSTSKVKKRRWSLGRLLRRI